ncbi:MAG: AAA family ATPase, partial [Clostridia bacterium]|nr:AAA family ATPase [Clostridia bacterium]
DAIDQINSYDLILFLEPDVRFVQDGGRSEIIHENREKYSEQIKEIFRTHHKNFVCISGNYQNRYLQAIKEVEKLFNDSL